MICNASGSSIVGPYIGVTGTPVIDANANTLYVVAAVEIPTDSPPPPPASYVLFAVDITSGAVKASTSVSGSVPGLAPSTECKTSSGQGTVTFDVNHLQRPALLLLGSGSSAVVYVGFVSGPVEGVGEFNNGWLFGYQFSGGSFTQTAIFNTTPNGTGGGIWQSGAGPASDGNYIYLATGNGTFDLAGVQNPSFDAGDTLLQLNPSNFAVHGYYTPSDVFTYNGNGRCTPPNDEDFGSGGVSLPPSGFSYNTMKVVINADKESNLYVANQGSLGGFNSNGGNNIQTLLEPHDSNGHKLDADQGYWASPAYWEYMTGSTPTYMLYNSATTDRPTAAPYPINGYHLLTSGTLGPVPDPPTASTVAGFCQYSPTPSVSSNGTTAGTGIVWAIEHGNSNNPSRNNCAGNSQQAALHAFNATTMTELYTSRGLPSGTTGSVTTFSTPTIFKGHVYMGTQTGVNVFGLCTSCPH
jgi:hypothetical protein